MVSLLACVLCGTANSSACGMWSEGPHQTHMGGMELAGSSERRSRKPQGVLVSYRGVRMDDATRQ